MRILLVAIVALAGCDPGPQGTREGHHMLAPPRTMIGSVKMNADGTLVLDLRHPWAHREIPPGHPEHDGLVAHVGGLRPGEEKPVPPWPDDIDDAEVEARLQAHVRTLGLSPDDCTATIDGTDPAGNVLVTVVCGPRHLRLRLRTGDYAVSEAETR